MPPTSIDAADRQVDHTNDDIGEIGRNLLAEMRLNGVAIPAVVVIPAKAGIHLRHRGFPCRRE